VHRLMFNVLLCFRSLSLSIAHSTGSIVLQNHGRLFGVNSTLPASQ
jgi:hypothetical protein